MATLTNGVTRKCAVRFEVVHGRSGMQVSSCMSRRASEATQASDVEEEGTMGWWEVVAQGGGKRRKRRNDEFTNTFLLATNNETRYRSVVTKEVYTEKIKFYGTPAEINCDHDN
ncbi:hypothetical protein V1478_004533 [Vespula squamosa]|uniref:Uncharacterized protein n=1 Tax=Vespula squamosa TaxID=30214 RepID=A0ABD2BGR9_VESSQ